MPCDRDKCHSHSHPRALAAAGGPRRLSQTAHKRTATPMGLIVLLTSTAAGDRGRKFVAPTPARPAQCCMDKRVGVARCKVPPTPVRSPALVPGVPPTSAANDPSTAQSSDHSNRNECSDATTKVNTRRRPQAVGARLRAAREAAGLSQRQLAFNGCSPAYISRIESGDRIPSLQLLRELGRRLGVSEDFLATGSDPRERDETMIEAEVALRLGELDLAEDLYTRLAEAGPIRRSRRSRMRASARSPSGRGDPRLAIQQFERALELEARTSGRHRRPRGLARTRLRHGRRARVVDRGLRARPGRCG